MKYNASVNIEQGVGDDYRYIITPNARRVLGELVTSVNEGVHAFSIIGTYGTGKSSFVIALEQGLETEASEFVSDRRVFFGRDSFEIINVVGEYASLRRLLEIKLKADGKNVLEELKKRCQRAEKKKRVLILVIDEFGKVLEHAAKNNPEEELYFIQQLCELVNDYRREALLITTLHQNFGSYAAKLSDAQRQEWQKVKGRFKDVVFSEPAEQLLFMAAEQLSMPIRQLAPEEAMSRLYHLALQCKYISESLSQETALRLNPLEPFAAICLTAAIQKYGQNERSLFSFLTSRGQFSLLNHGGGHCYSLSDVYDYITYTFYTEVSQASLESSGWTALNVAIGRVESGILPDDRVQDALAIVKTIGLLSVLGRPSGRFDRDALLAYCTDALGIPEPEALVQRLESAKIIRYASYKSQFILFDGTDLDIEEELLRAAAIVPVPAASVEELKDYVREKVALASAAYYLRGTPRYFGFVVGNEPEPKVPDGDIDGFCQLVFPLDEGCEKRVKALSAENGEANLFAVFRNVDEIVKHLYEIKKLQYIADKVAVDDVVALREIGHMQTHRKNCLNRAINDSLYSGSGDVVWYYAGKPVEIRSKKDFNKCLSRICEEVYSGTPVLRNELFNRQKLSSAISLAKVNLMAAILDHPDLEDLGLEGFPPEKTIYLTLLKETGIHRQDADGAWVFSEPTHPGMQVFWEACEAFVARTTDHPRKLIELIKLLKAKPFKLKQGVIDFWIPIYLYIKQQDLALYGASGNYVMNINREVFELLWKQPGDFSIKAFNVSGVKLEFFRKYRQFLQKDEGVLLNRDSFANTFKPFLFYFRNLNEYAKHTRKFNNPDVARFRDILSAAVDPEKVFFEDLPEALGYKEGMPDDEFIPLYLEKIKAAVRELNACYPALIGRIEHHLVENLGLDPDYGQYKQELESRYCHVKRHLLAQRSRAFLDRVLAPSASAQEFIEKIANVVLDKHLSKLLDKEEEALLDNLLFLFRDLDRYCGLSELEGAQEGDVLYSFGLLNTEGVQEPQRTYRLPKAQSAQMLKTKEALEKKLTKDANLNVCILLELLAEQIKK